MAKNKKSASSAIIYPGFLHLHRGLLESDDFISLRGNSLKMLIDLAAQYNGRNNGNLCAAMSILKKREWNSNQQITKAVHELEGKNLIVKTKQGGRNIGPSLYAITWQPINECGGKLEVNATTSPPRSFK